MSFFSSNFYRRHIWRMPEKLSEFSLSKSKVSPLLYEKWNCFFFASIICFIHARWQHSTWVFEKSNSNFWWCWAEDDPMSFYIWMSPYGYQMANNQCFIFSHKKQFCSRTSVHIVPGSQFQSSGFKRYYYHFHHWTSPQYGDWRLEMWLFIQVSSSASVRSVGSCFPRAAMWLSEAKNANHFWAMQMTASQFCMDLFIFESITWSESSKTIEYIRFQFESILQNCCCLHISA